MLRRLTLLVGLILPLAGCFEVNSESTFRPDGTALVTVELGISNQLLALLGGDSSGTRDPFGECDKTPAKDKWPPGVRSLEVRRGQRADLITCLLTMDVSDPVAFSAWRPDAIGSGAAAANKDKGGFTIARIGERQYRVSAHIKPPAEAAKNDPNAKLGNAILAALTANRYLTFRVRALHIANTNGEVQEDGRLVVWKVPMLALAQRTPGVEYEFHADVTYSESWLDRAKRWVGLTQ